MSGDMEAGVANEETLTDYEGMNIEELKRECQVRKLTFSTLLGKEALIEILEYDDNKETTIERNINSLSRSPQ
jgi:hypothetical protein